MLNVSKPNLNLSDNEGRTCDDLLRELSVMMSPVAEAIRTADEISFQGVGERMPPRDNPNPGQASVTGLLMHPW
jgi:hypothetical protein